MNKIISKTLDIMGKFSNYLRGNLILAVARDNMNGDRITSRLLSENEITEELLNEWAEEHKDVTTEEIEDAFEYINVIQYALGKKEAIENDEFLLLDDYPDIDSVLFSICDLTREEAAYILNIIMQYNYDICKRHISGVFSYDEFIEKGMTRHHAYKLIYQYTHEPLELDNEQRTLVKELLEKDAQDATHKKEIYSYIRDFSSKVMHTQDEYEDLSNALLEIKMTKDLSLAYVDYFYNRQIQEEERKRQREEIKDNPFKKEEVKEELPTISKKELKAKLNDIQNSENFDFKNLNELLTVLRQLSYPDSVVANTLYSLYPKAVKNEAYYEYMVKKADYMKKYDNQLEELRVLREMYAEADESNRNEIRQMQQEIYDELEEEVLNEESDFEESKLMLEFKEN